MKKLLVILGATSTGKTDIALSLAKKFNGELVSCDSRQVYKELDIGTGKLPGGRWKIENGRWKKGKGYWEMDGIKVWMYDVVDSNKQYTAYNFVKDANKVIDDILKRGKLPIIVGGTGLYLKALIEGLSNLAIPIDSKLRKQLNNLTTKQLQQELQKISPDKRKSLNESDKQNPRRLIRAIEILSIRTPPRSNFHLRASFAEVATKAEQDFGGQAVTPRRWKETLKIGLTAPREILYQRIDERVVTRINQGMIEEAERLHMEGLSFKRMKQLGLEYGVLADYLEGKIPSTEALIKKLQGKIHGYARRQITWFKKEKFVYWFDIIKPSWESLVESQIDSWYYSGNDKTH